MTAVHLLSTRNLRVAAAAAVDQLAEEEAEEGSQQRWVVAEDHRNLVDCLLAECPNSSQQELPNHHLLI